MAWRPIAIAVVAILIVIGIGIGILAATGNGGLAPTRADVTAIQRTFLAQANGLVSDGIKWEVVGPAASGHILNVLILDPTPSAIAKLERHTGASISSSAQYLSVATASLRGEFGPFVDVTMTAHPPVPD